MYNNVYNIYKIKSYLKRQRERDGKKRRKIVLYVAGLFAGSRRFARGTAATSGVRPLNQRDRALSELVRFADDEKEQ